MSELDNKKRSKRKIEIPWFFVILMLFFGAIGLVACLLVNKTVRHCTNEVTGFVESEGYGGNGDLNQTVEGKYVRVGTQGQHWIAIYVNTDDKFQMNTVYADKSYGNVGDKFTIYYNPEDPDEYYIGDYRYLNGYGVALVTLVISGINLVLTVVFTFFFNKELTEEEKEIKREKKEKRAAERKRNGEEKIERGTRRYTKNYTNTHIRKKIQDFVVEVKGGIITLIIGSVIFASSFVVTYLDINKDRPIPFNNYSDTFDGKVYSVETEKPIEISTLADYGVYYDLKVGNDHILAVHLNNREINGIDGSIKLRGKLCRVSVRDEKKREIIKAYYKDLGYLDTLKDEEFAYYCLDCTKISFWEEMKQHHMIGFAFGLVIIIAGLMFSSALYRLIRFFRPRFSGRRYKASEIDRLANDMDTEWLGDVEVLGTPSALIGLNHGLTVVDYSDIHGVKVEAESHKRKNRREWFTYKIYIETKKHKNILLTESDNKYDYYSLKKHLEKRFVTFSIVENS